MARRELRLCLDEPKRTLKEEPDIGCEQISAVGVELALNSIHRGPQCFETDAQRRPGLREGKNG